MSRYGDLLALKAAGGLLAKLERVEGSSALPDAYGAFLREIGFGQIGGVFMLYSGPIAPAEVLGAAEPAWNGVVLVGDDFAGRLTGLRLTDGSVVEGDPPYDRSPIAVAADFETFVRARIAGLASSH